LHKGIRGRSLSKSRIFFERDLQNDMLYSNSKAQLASVIGTERRLPPHGDVIMRVVIIAEGLNFLNGLTA